MGSSVHTHTHTHCRWGCGWGMIWWSCPRSPAAGRCGSGSTRWRRWSGTRWAWSRSWRWPGSTPCRWCGALHSCSRWSPLREHTHTHMVTHLNTHMGEGYLFNWVTCVCVCVTTHFHFWWCSCRGSSTKRREELVWHSEAWRWNMKLTILSSSPFCSFPNLWSFLLRWCWLFGTLIP